MPPRYYLSPEYRPTAEQRHEREARQRDAQLRMSPGSRYWPAKVVVEAPKLPDGSLDVREWLRQLDDTCNAAVVPC